MKNVMTEELYSFINKTQKTAMELYDEYNSLSNGAEYTCELTDLIDRLYEFSLLATNDTIVDNSSETETCKWIKYDHRTICPKYHDIDNPYWRIPKNMDKLKYCPYCGKEIRVVKDHN